MTVYGQYGIYSGGILSLDPVGILISSYKVTTASGGATGSGGDSNNVARRVSVEFSQTQNVQFIANRSDNKSAVLKLIIKTNGLGQALGNGQAWIYYDNAIKEINGSVSATKPVGAGIAVLGKITWVAGITTVASLAIETDGIKRDEALIQESIDPSDSSKLFFEGMRWSSGSKNIPYASFSILADVMQSETRLTLGDNYFITFAQNSDVVGSGYTVTLKDSKHYSRSSTNIYRTYHTKENSELYGAGNALIKTFANPAEFQGMTIYIMINKVSGVPLIDTSYNSSTHYLIAKGSAGNSETDLANVEFDIVNDLGGTRLLVEQVASLVRSDTANGFLSPFKIESISTNSIRLLANTLNVDGYLSEISTTDISLGNAPVSGYRYDFVYVESYKESLPWTVLKTEYKIINGVDYASFLDPFLEGINNTDGNPYEYIKEKGYYRAVDTTNAVDGYTYAYPVALVHRFNQNGWIINTNTNGGTLRPDGKTHNIIDMEEVDILAPCNFKYDKPSELNKAINLMLTGVLSRLQPAYNNSLLFSKCPLQIDRLGNSAPVTGTTFIGATDGIRYNYGANQSIEHWMYGLFREDLDGGTTGIGSYAFPSFTYEDSSKVVSILVPTGTEGELVTDSNNQPTVNAFWVNDGQAVVFTGSWSVGNPSIASNTIDSSDASAHAGKEVALMFKLKYTDTIIPGITKIPKVSIGCAINGNLSTLSQNFAVALDTYDRSTYIKEEARSQVIGGDTYYDKLYLKRLGNTHKYGTYEYHYHLEGNNNNGSDYIVPATVGDYQFVGIVDMIRQDTGESMPIERVLWNTVPSSEFVVRQQDVPSGKPPVPLGVPVIFIMAVSGDADKQIDIDLGSLSVSNITRSVVRSISADAINQPDGIYKYSDGHIIYGVSSIKSQYGVYVGEDYIPCNVSGVGTNLISIDLYINSDTYARYVSIPANWQAYLTGYIPKNPGVIRVPLLESYKTGAGDIYFYYKYSSLPYYPYMPSSGRYYNDSRSPSRLETQGEIVARGYVLAATDGRANPRGSYVSPFSERLPEVDNVPLVGIDTPASALLWQDLLNSTAHIGKPLLEGSLINFDSEYALGVNIESSSGVVAYYAVVKFHNMLRVFLYTKRNGQLVLDSADNAFITDFSSVLYEV